MPMRAPPNPIAETSRPVLPRGRRGIAAPPAGAALMPAAADAITNCLLLCGMPPSYHTSLAILSSMECAICEKRRPRRFCPAVRGQICPICCGESREMTLECPLDCEFLVEARKHERAAELRPEDFPNKDIEVTEELITANENLLLVLG